MFDAEVPSPAAVGLMCSPVPGQLLATGLVPCCQKRVFTEISFFVCFPNTFLKMSLLKEVFTEDLIKVPETRDINIASNFVGFQTCPTPAKEIHKGRTSSKKVITDLQQELGLKPPSVPQRPLKWLHWDGGAFKLLRCLNAIN